MNIDCLSKLVSINIPCKPDEKCSGFVDISDMRGFSWDKVSKLANEQLTAETLLHSIRRKAINTFGGDLGIILAQNGYILNLVDSVFSTEKAGAAPMSPNKNGYENYEMGKKVGLHLRQKKGCKFKRLRINNICINAEHTGTQIVYVYNGLYEYNFTVNTIAGKEVCITHEDFCEKYGEGISVTGQDIWILVDGTNYRGYGYVPTCACGIGSKNCADVEGWKGDGVHCTTNGRGNAVTTYGIRADVSCECRWDELICAISATNGNNAISRLLLLLCEKQFIDEIKFSSRLNYFTVFADDADLDELRATISNEYKGLFNSFIQGIANIIKNNDYDDCIKCENRVQFIQNI